jgi:hypothetical protein
MIPFVSDKQKPKTEPQVELEPDSWERFERFIKEVAKKPPQHRTKKEGAPSTEDAPKAKKKS